MPPYAQPENHFYDRSMEMIGASLMLVSIAEHGTPENRCVGFTSSLQRSGLSNSSWASKSYRTGLSQLASATTNDLQRYNAAGMPTMSNHQVPESDTWGYFIEDQ